MYDTTVLDFYGLSATKGEVGIEIEMEGCDLPKDSVYPYWTPTNDGSLRGEAVEYVLSSPVSRSEVKIALDSLTEEFNKVGSFLEPSNRCGVHVHLNMQKEKMITVINFIVLYLMFEDILVHWCGGEREGNLFCLRTKDAESLIPKIEWAIENDRFVFDDSVRYASINILALAKFGSLEFRSLPTRIDLSEIVTWTEMLLCIKDAASQFNYPSEIISTLSGQGPEGFFHRIMKDKAEILEFPGYESHILRAMRRVQPLAMMRELREGFKYPDKKEHYKEDYIVARARGAGRNINNWANIQPIRYDQHLDDEDINILLDDVEDF